MLNVDFTNIDNAKLVGRLLPFWARGKKISLLMQALLSPLTMAHDSFKAWALELYIQCHITAQQSSLEWYLNYKLKSHFRNTDDTFFVVHGINESLSCFSSDVWRNALHWDNVLRWTINTEPLVAMNMNITCINTGVWINNALWNDALLYENEDNGKSFDDSYLESIGRVNVYAPAITDTIEYNSEDYERDIRNIMSKFMINFDNIYIYIANVESTN